MLNEGKEQLLDSHRRDVTVVFGDLRGFIGLRRNCRTRRGMGVLREYHNTIGPLVHKYEGTIERFIGDGFLVLFNDPLPCPNSPVRAIRMATEMRACMAELAEGVAQARARTRICYRHRPRVRHAGPHRF